MKEKQMELIQPMASPILIYILAGLYALISAIVTFVENSYGPVIACEYFYYAPWFTLLQLLQAVNLSTMFLQGSYFKRISKGSLTSYGTSLFIWLRAAVTYYAGVTGIVYIREGKTTSSMMEDEGAGMEKTSLPSSVTLDDSRLRRHLGSHSPMSYESDLVIKGENESPLQATIRMNKATDIDGYHPLQSSSDPDEQGTALSMSYGRLDT